MTQYRLNRRHFLQGLCALGAVASTGSPLAFAASASNSMHQGIQETRLLLGTFVTITANAASRAQAEDAAKAAFAEILRLESIFNRHSTTTAISVLNAQGKLSLAPTELMQVLSYAKQMSQQTLKLFNPAVAPLVDAYKTAGNLPLSKNILNEALALSQPAEVHLNDNNIQMGRMGMQLTLDGIAKGYIADMASAILLNHGIPNHMVNAGGDIRVHGVNAKGHAWQVGIQHPLDKTGTVASSNMRSGGIATSGNYEAKSLHLINVLADKGGTPKTFLPLSVTVKAPSAMQADALATALCTVSPLESLRILQTIPVAQCLILGPNGEKYKSSGWA